MTRTGPAKTVISADGDLRLKKARAYHKSAYQIFEQLSEGELADPAVSNMVLAAIGYADALTARIGGAINRKNHAAVGKLLREKLGKQFPNEQEMRLARLLSRKDEAQYGAAPIRRTDAENLLKDLNKFAAWAESKLSS